MAPVGSATVACVSGVVLVIAGVVVILVGGVVALAAAAAAAETTTLFSAFGLCALPTGIDGAATALTACKSPFFKMKLVNGAATELEEEEQEEAVETELLMEAAERPVADKTVCTGVVVDESVDANAIVPPADEAAA